MWFWCQGAVDLITSRRVSFSGFWMNSYRIGSFPFERLATLTSAPIRLQNSLGRKCLRHTRGVHLSLPPSPQLFASCSLPSLSKMPRWVARLWHCCGDFSAYVCVSVSLLVAAVIGNSIIHTVHPLEVQIRSFLHISLCTPYHSSSESILIIPGRNPECVSSHSPFPLNHGVHLENFSMSVCAVSLSCLAFDSMEYN